MKIEITARELLDLGLWGRYCDITGHNPYAINEGMPDNRYLPLTVNEAKELNILEEIINYED